ncbi:TolC family outer membrane protein [Psychrobium sp. 1_MG-2023]|uniref:TolC family outer membrane protein n=1 Tax=Psychrobium sp. 1_MG-2023 TaxID=3062624 RepID=UPI000C31D83F|nr:TolC family outer membrane protein [Psychrobium sp. 1_MG-2023]MDP2560979.1 TolC family outer membrane protein [Psychrobium sp. 1_MG-2023]PKF54955.1 channel protein TolC [Alteromonadales bacterium alter-6D02]
MRFFNRKQPLYKKTISVLSLSVATALVSNVVSGQTLEQAVAMALDTNPEVRIALSRFKVTEEQYKQAAAGYLPTVDLSAGYGFEETNSPGTRRGANDDGQVGLKRGEFSLSIKQMLFDGFYTSSERSRTEFEASAEQWQVFSTAEDLALEVANAYTAVLQAEQVLALSRKNLESHQVIFEQIKQRTDSGLGSVADLSQVSGRLARANVNVISATNNYLDATATYKKLIDTQPQDLIIPVPDADLLPASKQEGLTRAIENHPTIKSAGNDIEATRYAKESTNSSYYPTISFEIDANLNNNTGGEEGIDRLGVDVGGHNNNASAMIRMKYNLYSGNKHSAQTRAAAYRISEAVEVNHRAHRDVTEGYMLAWNAYELLASQKTFIQQHVESSKETQTSYEQQFKLGQRSLLDLLDTENELFEARKDYLSAEYQEINAKYRLLNATGQLLDSLRVTRSSLWNGEESYEGGVK